MSIAISGQHISIGSALQEYSKDKTIQMVKKYFTDIINIDIHFAKNSSHFTCNIIVKYGSGKHNLVNSSITSDEIYNAFDMSLTKLEEQLRKHKSKFKNHHTGKVKISELSLLNDTTKSLDSDDISEEEPL